MDKAWFDSLPALCRNRKYAFEELHALDCAQPRPVAVKVGSGHKKLPADLWQAAEFLVAALQGEEVFECETCNIDAFLLQLLHKAVVAADVLGTSACLGPNGIVSLFTARAKPSATKSKPRDCRRPATSPMDSEGPAKVDAVECTSTSVLQEAQQASEKAPRDGQALGNEQNDVAEGQDERHKGQDTAAATKEGANKEAEATHSTEPSQQETAKQRRRKKRRERLRQQARAQFFEPLH